MSIKLKLKEVSLVKIPLKDSSFSAGLGTPFDDGFSEIEVPEELIRATKNPFAITVTGDSMETTLFSGDLAVLTFDANPKSGDLIAINYNGENFIKEFVSTKNGLYLKSHNKEYKEIEISPDDSFEILGKVIYSLRKH